MREIQEDASGAKLQRQGLDEIRDLARDGLIDVLLVSDTDRLTRDLGHLMLLVDEMERARVELKFTNAPHDNTPEGMMLVQMRGMFAQYERLKIRERTRRGKEKRIKEGAIFVSKQAAFGYKYIVGKGKLEVVEAEAYWLRRMFEWASEGLSLRKIAQKLHEAAVPTKTGAATWSPAVIRNILINELYTGVWHYGRRSAIEPLTPSKTGKRAIPKDRREANPREAWLSAPAPALVTREVFDAVQPQLQRNKLLSPRNSKYPYLLKGILICGTCGYRMYGHNKINGAHNRLAYECAGRSRVFPAGRTRWECNQITVTAAHLETLVWDEVVRQICHPTLLVDAIKKNAASHNRLMEKDYANIHILTETEKATKSAINELLDLYQSDIIDKDTLKERMATLRQRLESISSAKAQAEARLSETSYNEPLKALQSLTTQEKEALAQLSFDDKRAFLLRFNIQVSLKHTEVTITGLIEPATLILKTRYKYKPITKPTV